MDKPLSQERLSEKELRRIEKHVANRMKQSEFVAMKVIDAETLISEVKRLQAIEAERNKYKFLASRFGSEYELESIYKVLKGAVNHE